MIFQNHHVLQESSETKLHVLTLYIVGVLTSYCRLEYCSSMLEKMAARKWLDSKTLKNFWLELALAIKILAC